MTDDPEGKYITGLLFLDCMNDALTNMWGYGYFLNLSFADDGDDALDDIKVGLSPSQGSGLVSLDEDMRGTFKYSFYTEHPTEKLVIEGYKDGFKVFTDEYDLTTLTPSALLIDTPVNVDSTHWTADVLIDEYMKRLQLENLSYAFDKGDTDLEGTFTVVGNMSDGYSINLELTGGSDTGILMPFCNVQYTQTGDSAGTYTIDQLPYDIEIE